MNHNSIFQALSDPTRRAIIQMLKQEDLTPGIMLEKFNMTKPSLSHHLDILKKADMVTTERQGQHIVYSLNLSVFDEMIGLMMDLFSPKAKGGTKNV